MAEKTTALTPAEWRGLCMLNAAQLHATIEGQQHGALSVEALPMLELHLERIRAFLKAWSVSDVKPAQEQAQVQPTTNGHMNGTAPKKRGGWPLGKPRKRMNPMVQQ